MSKPKGNRPRVNLNDYKAKKEEEGSIAIDIGDGQTVTVPAPALWPDDTAARFNAQNELDPAELAEILVGPEQFAAFCAAGGTGTLLLSIVNDELGLTAPE